MAALALATLLVGGACGGGGASDGGDDAAQAEPTRSVPSSRSGSASSEQGDADEVETSDGAAMAATTVPSGQAAGGDGAAAGGVEAQPALQPVDLGRSIIFTATVDVEVADVATASTAAMTAVASTGGFLFGQQASSDPLPTSVLTFKVVPTQFQAALAALGALGELRDQTITTDDVTGQVVDLESRIRAAEISVERLRGFLATAPDVNALASLERELLERETQLETLRGQLRAIEAQVDLATITLTLHQPAPAGPGATVTVTGYAGGGEDIASCPGDDEVRLTEGERLTVCYEVANTGDTALGQLRLDDPGLDLARDDLRVLQGDLGAALAPGAAVLLAAELDALTDARPQPRLRSVALDDSGTPSRAAVQTETVGLTLDVDEDTTPAGFTDGLRASGRALGWLAAVLVLLAGALLPFIWVVPVAIGARLWWRGHRRPVVAPSHPGPAGPGSDAGPPVGPTAPGGPPSGTARPVGPDADQPGDAAREPVGAPSGPPPGR